MKRKWTYLAVAVLSIATVASVDAQRGAFGKVRGAAIAHKLGLNDDQKAQMKTLRETHRDAIKSLRASGERPSRDEMKELFSSHREQMEQILTPDQLDQLNRWKSERGDRGKGRNSRDNSSMHSKRDGRSALVEQLDLSQEQRTRIESIRSDFKTRMQELHAAHKSDQMALLSQAQSDALTAHKSEKDHHRGKIDLGLSEEQRTALSLLRTTYKEAYDALKEEHRQEFAAVLTDQQAAALEALRNARPERGQRRGHAGSNRGDSADLGSQMSESSLQSTHSLPTAVESTSWGQIKKDLSE